MKLAEFYSKLAKINFQRGLFRLYTLWAVGWIIVAIVAAIMLHLEWEPPPETRPKSLRDIPIVSRDNFADLVPENQEEDRKERNIFADIPIREKGLLDIPIPEKEVPCGHLGYHNYSEYWWGEVFPILLVIVLISLGPWIIHYPIKYTCIWVFRGFQDTIHN